MLRLAVTGLVLQAAALPAQSATGVDVDLHAKHKGHKSHKHSGHKSHKGHKSHHSDHTAAASAGEGSAVCTGTGCWPRMYIIGAQKSGTTSMFDQMANQGACGSGGSGDVKEGHFFDNDWHAGISTHTYTKRYGGEGKSCKHNLYLDATPDYIRHWYAPQRMHEFFPAEQKGKVRMLLLLREPIARDLSYYNHMLANHLHKAKSHMSAGLGEDVCDNSYLSAAKTPGKAPAYSSHVSCEIKIWEKCLAAAGGSHSAAYAKCQDLKKKNKGGETGKTYLTSGMYAAQVKRWTSYWRRNQILVLQMESLLKETKTYMAHVYGFMGFPAPPPAKLPNKNEKKYSFTVHSIQCSTKERLKQVYAPWNAELYSMTSNDHAQGKVSPHEPAFPHFPDTVSCHGSSLTEEREDEVMAKEGEFDEDDEEMDQEGETQEEEQESSAPQPQVSTVPLEASTAPDAAPAAGALQPPQ